MDIILDQIIRIKEIPEFHRQLDIFQTGGPTEHRSYMVGTKSGISTSDSRYIEGQFRMLGSKFTESANGTIQFLFRNTIRWYRIRLALQAFCLTVYRTEMCQSITCRTPVMIPMHIATEHEDFVILQ